jgi:hypothetical protein
VLGGAVGEVGHAEGVVAVPAPPPRVGVVSARWADSLCAVGCGNRPVHRGI